MLLLHIKFVAMYKLSELPLLEWFQRRYHQFFHRKWKYYFDNFKAVTVSILWQLPRPQRHNHHVMH